MFTGWTNDNLEAAKDPRNRRGFNPAYRAAPIRYPDRIFDDQAQQIEWTGSGNYQFVAPVINLSGRGLDLNLELVYNSQLWTLTGSGVAFDMDFGWPAPGWSLGFGKLGTIINNPPPDTVFFVGRDGGHHRFVEVASPGAYKARTTDGSMLEYLSGGSFGNIVRFPDGSVMSLGARGDAAQEDYSAYPTQITDANGNYITITYRNNTGPAIATITDTLGRLIQFHYDPNGLLTAVSAPGLGGGRRTVLRLHYRLFSFGAMRSLFRFREVDEIELRSYQFYVLDAIYYPETKQGYWFGDPDSYSPYGMIGKISRRREMGFTASGLEEQGAVTPGLMTHERRYFYQRPARLQKPPVYRRMEERWEGMYSPGPAVTVHRIGMTDRNDRRHRPHRMETTNPDGTFRVGLMVNDPQDPFDGLVDQIELYEDATVTRLLERRKHVWEIGEHSSRRLRQLIVTNEVGLSKTVEYHYGPLFNQLTDTLEYDFDGVTLLRRTHTEYLNAQPYLDRHILNLSSVSEIYDGAASLPVSRTEFYYDGSTLEDAPGVANHDPRYNPHATVPGNPFDPATLYRGNLTRLVTYADAANRTGSVVNLYRYDIAGNNISAVTACCEETTYRYTPATQYGYPDQVTRGSRDPNSPVRLVTQFSYDFHTGLLLSTVDANGLLTETRFDPATLRLQAVLRPSGARTTYLYDDAGMSVSETTEDAARQVASQLVTRLNGLGQVITTERLSAPGQWDYIETRYDLLGRVFVRSLPHRGGGTPPWLEYTYDALGRITRITSPDGQSVVEYRYNESQRPSSASPDVAGVTTRVIDPWGRERWMRADALGRLVEVVEPEPGSGGSVYAPGNMPTHYSCDVAGRIVGVMQGRQRREFRYDSLGRLTHQWLAERNPALTDQGEFRRPGTHWSDLFFYDDRSNLVKHLDARGVQTRYVYGLDPLNRLQAIEYDLSQFDDQAHPVNSAARVTFEYMGAGDVTRLQRVRAAGVAAEEYTYNSLAQLASRTLNLVRHPGSPLQVEFDYNSFGQLVGLRYPAEYGPAGSVRSFLQPSYDQTGGLTGLDLDGVSVAAQIRYHPSGAITGLQIGAPRVGPLSEAYEYDPLDGVLLRQTVTAPGGSLMDLSYTYNRGGGDRARTGHLTGLIDNLDQGKNRRYQYDALGRLISAYGGDASNPAWVQNYGYDRYGNRQSVIATQSLGPIFPGTELGAEMRDGMREAAYDPRTNRITTPGFEYDAVGNLTRAQRPDGSWHRYRYDAAGRLSQSLRDDGTVLETYTYGADRRRLVVETGDLWAGTHQATWYLWDGDVVLAEYKESAAAGLEWAKNNIYLGSRLLATRSAGMLLGTTLLAFHHPDRLGTRLITGANPLGGLEVIEQLTFPFGKSIDSESTGGVSRRFTSYERSATTGLDYAVNRFYDPYQGRFTQVDPLLFAGVGVLNSQGLNLFSYVGNNPVNLVDSTGLVVDPSPCSTKVYTYVKVGLDEATIERVSVTWCGADASVGMGSVALQVPQPKPGPGTIEALQLNADEAARYQACLAAYLDAIALRTPRKIPPRDMSLLNPFRKETLALVTAAVNAVNKGAEFYDLPPMEAFRGGGSTGRAAVTKGSGAILAVLGAAAAGLLLGTYLDQLDTFIHGSTFGDRLYDAYLADFDIPTSGRDPLLINESVNSACIAQATGR